MNTFHRDVEAAIPALRRYARALTRDAETADDLVQDTLERALSRWLLRRADGDVRAWLFTILRNVYFTELRRKRREVEDVEGQHAASIAVAGEQAAHLDMSDFQNALARLPPDQREVLTLVGASGFSYEEAAEICGVAVGTIKSRLNRARARLASLLAIGHVSDIGPDRATLAATSPPLPGHASVG